MGFTLLASAGGRTTTIASEAINKLGAVKTWVVTNTWLVTSIMGVISKQD